jgi:RNA polymerase sigma-70 factor (ECF subfamily)
VLGHGTDADDVVQMASERAWRAIATVDPDRGFRPWFLRIVANTARNHQRARWRRRRAELRVANRADVEGDDAGSPAITAEERAVVVAALNRLAAHDRLVIALRHFEQLGEREMADVLECPPGTVKSRLSRAMARLRAELTVETLDG